MNNNKYLKDLFSVLPGDIITQIHIGSNFPADIINLIDEFKSPCDTIALTTGDVWRYFDFRDQMFSHPKFNGKNVFLVTMGYDNIKVKPNHYEISLPMWYWQRRISTDAFSPKAINLNYGFSCLNNRASIDRLVLGYKFYTNNLLSGIIFSQNLVDHENSINRVEQDFLFDRFTEYKNLLPIRVSGEANNQPANFRRYRGVPGYVNLVHPAFDDAYCNIYVESECEEYPYSRNINLPVVTEKSHKPFIARQIPLALAARGHMAYLEGLGFEMFKDLLPVGYDNMRTLEKIDAIVNLVSKGKEFIQDYYFSHLKEIQHNYELVNSDKVEQLVLQRIRDLVNT